MSAWMDIFYIIILHKLRISFSCIYNGLVYNLLFCLARVWEWVFDKKEAKRWGCSTILEDFCKPHGNTHGLEISTWACVPLMECFITIFNCKNDTGAITHLCTHPSIFSITIPHDLKGSRPNHQPHGWVGPHEQHHELAHGCVPLLQPPINISAVTFRENISVSFNTSWTYGLEERSWWSRDWRTFIDQERERGFGSYYNARFCIRFLAFGFILPFNEKLNSFWYSGLLNPRTSLYLWFYFRFLIWD